jgi:hypothetical protein
MLEYLYLICLLCLTISVPILIRGCFQIHRELPTQGGTISDKIDDVSGVLNELADFIADLSRGINPSSVNTQPPTIVETLLTALLKPNTPSHVDHGKTQQTVGEIYEIIDPNTKETENEFSEHSS